MHGWPSYAGRMHLSSGMRFYYSMWELRGFLLSDFWLNKIIIKGTQNVHGNLANFNVLLTSILSRPEIKSTVNRVLIVLLIMGIYKYEYLLDIIKNIL